MSERSAGLFAGRTRHLARHHRPSSLSVRDIIKDVKVGESVAIVPKGNFKNIPHPRYRGKVGKVVEIRGAAYVVEINVYNAKRTLVVPAVHVQKVATQKSGK